MKVLAVALDARDLTPALFILARLRTPAAVGAQERSWWEGERTPSVQIAPPSCPGSLAL